MADTTTEPKEAPSKTEKVVRYTGNADVRKIDVASFERHGVTVKEEVVWDRSNGFTVKASDLNKAAVDFLGKTAGFSVEDVEV